MKLNDTYLAFGAQGAAQKQNQHMQDTNAAGLSREAAVQRLVAKSSSNYSNASWDLIDALQQKKVKLEDIDKDQLPEPMQAMTLQQRGQYVQARARERAQIQARIQQLNAQRKAFLAQAQKQQNPEKTLGSAIIMAIQEQAREKAFVFPHQKPQNRRPGNEQ